MGQGTSWLWLAVLAILFVVLIGWFLDPLGYAGKAEPGHSSVQSQEWTVAPDGPAVPVNLPEVVVKPAGEASTIGSSG